LGRRTNIMKGSKRGREAGSGRTKEVRGKIKRKQERGKLKYFKGEVKEREQEGGGELEEGNN